MPSPSPTDPTRATTGSSGAVHRLWLSPQAHPIDAPENQSVLQSALDAGIELVSSCRNGTCRACIRQLAQGQVSYRIEWPGLSTDEQDEGFILPCVAHPCSDLVLKPCP